MNLIALAAVFLIASLVLGFDIWSFPLITPDEPRYAETAREMLEQGQYIVPYCDYEPRFDKPVLFYWFEVISFKFFGLNEFAARLPSVLAGAGLVSLAFLLGSLQSYGFIAAAIMLTSLKIFVLAKLAITDMVLAFFISATISFFYLAYRDRLELKQRFALSARKGSAWLPAAFVMMGFGVLCKGPVAIVLPAVIFLGFLIYERELIGFVEDTWFDILFGLLIFLALVLPWYISVHLMTDGAFTQEFFLSHNFNRFTATHTGHGQPFWFYLPVLLVGIFPWTFFLFQALFYRDTSPGVNLRSETAKANHQVKFCLLWAVVILSFFTVSRTKLPTYILPAYLPLVMILARWWSTKFKVTKGNGYKNMDALIGYIALAITMLVAAVLVFWVFKAKLVVFFSGSILLPLAIIIFLFFSAAIIAMTAILSNARFAFVALIIASIMSYLLAAHLVMRPYAILRDSGTKQFMQQLKPEDRFVSYGVHRPRFEFYGQRKVDKLNHVALFDYLEEGSGYFVSHHRYLRRFKKYSNKHKTIEGPLYTKNEASSRLYFIGESTIGNGEILTSPAVPQDDN
ncbi:MAG: phospholipid carrier-dependent glycosyltransferase [Candidatus Melainabacteria bacterium]|nr:phospholipid carrier-dependent glycosyltransferase [Candidatus Melainabacteria bacterium]